jgi:hypothetical protein
MGMASFDAAWLIVLVSAVLTGVVGLRAEVAASA